MKVGIVGSGKLGNDIFHYLLNYYFQLVQVCIDEESAEKQRAGLQKKIKRQLNAGVIDVSKATQIEQDCVINHHIESLSDCNIVIECIWENQAAKQQLISSLIDIVQTDCVLTSNSSSFLPTSLTDESEVLKRFVGLHFFYPVPMRNIVEINTIAQNTQETIDIVVNFCHKIEKKFLLLPEKDSFMLNKLFLEVQNEAFLIYQEGSLGIESIDELVEKHLFPGGIFRFFDSVGNDIMLASIKNYVGNNNFDKYIPLIQKLNELCEKGHLGMKSRKGFYNYADTNQVMDLSKGTVDSSKYYDALHRLQKVYYETAIRAVNSGVCSKEELEDAITEYTGAETGPFTQYNLINK